MAGPDLSPLTTAVDFSSVAVAVLAVAASIVVVLIAWKGASLVIGFLRGDYDYGDGKDLLDYERQDWAEDDPPAVAVMLGNTLWYLLIAFWAIVCSWAVIKGLSDE